VKARLAALENGRKILNKDKDKDRPTLRRADQRQKKDDGDDGRPTLKRRDDQHDGGPETSGF
jgi:hypothetical protein